MSNDSMYHAGMRKLQDIRDTRRIADRLEQVIVHGTFTESDREFIHKCPMVFVATADAEGKPDCSYKGGLPGFVRVLDDKTLVLPDYDGNGMYRSWGNLVVNPHIGLLFIDFEHQSRLRVNGTAVISDDDPVRSEYPGSVFIVRMTVDKIFPACPRYIHKMHLAELSVYVPQANYSPPVPAWKTFDDFRDALPERDQVADD
ncbi:pyridoxamine 5'-phosphate oxidase family protein [Leeia oryzae]|uniref:pyridoxamine 5'-phosphate oxidase family protein n=1 Tax=Leeia oryzae TaxID=356662 RepID=UPI0003A2E03D|nr:pyridoxamine 5'-phosphate oxidase family protein [Leeia oryzae]